MIKEYFFSDQDSLFSALLNDCVAILATATAQGRQASMLVSGGSTPAPLYRQLSQQLLAWQQITIALVDERWVDSDHAGSNQAFISDNLLQQQAAAAQFIAMKTADKTAQLGKLVCEQHYQQLSRPFDLTILGMGLDGHTASLFPFADGIEAALDPNRKELVAAITAKPSKVTGELIERISLTLYGLLQSRQLHLLITGEEKLAVYQEALASDNVNLTPISAVLSQIAVPVHVYWAP